MKHLLKAIFTLIAAVLVTAASAQNTGAYLKFDLNGRTISYKNGAVNNYNKFEPGDENSKSGNRHVLYISYEVKEPYKLDIMIYTPPHSVPVVGKIPYVPIMNPPDGPCPAAHLSVTKNVGDEYEFYASEADNAGHFEITKVAAGWVEGKFEIDLPKEYSDSGEVLHITNGSFRFKIEKEMKD